MLSLARGNIDRDDLTRADPTAVAAAKVLPNARFLLVAGEWVASTGADLALLTYEQARGLGRRFAPYLGKDENYTYFACDVAEIFNRHHTPENGNSRTPATYSVVIDELGCSFQRVRYSAQLWPDNHSAVAVMAVALLNWKRNALYCERCGQELEVGRSGWQKECPSGHVVFPRTDPAVIMGVRDQEDRMLLGRNGAWGPGRISVLAGFVEAGETLEAAVAREVYEETRIRVDSMRYVASQPWPFPRSLMLAFHAYTHMGESDLAVDGKEMIYAHFYEREELASLVRAGEILIPTPTSVAYHLIEDWYGEPLSSLVTQ